jgi:hypothetical protein
MIDKLIFSKKFRWNGENTLSIDLSEIPFSIEDNEIRVQSERTGEIRTFDLEDTIFDYMSSHSVYKLRYPRRHERNVQLRVYTLK